MQKRLVTVSGLPVSIELQWPFKASSAGADFFVLHGEVRLEDGRGLFALASLQVTQTVRQVLKSLEPAEAESPAINTVRKAVDMHEIEFLKSPKRQPLPISSRQYDFKRNSWWFARASEAEIVEFLRRKVYWLGGEKVWLADPVDAEYLGAAPQRLVELAKGIAEIRVEGEHAYATDALRGMKEKFEAEMRKAVEELEQKHAFERA